MDLYASQPEKRRELEERINAVKNYAYELAAKFEQGLEQGIEKGLEQGIEKGELKKALETAGKMREEGFHLEQISRITGLSPKDLKEHGIL